jgi:sterol O-acyltransferase
MMLSNRDENYENYRTIFNIALSVLVLWGLSMILDDYMKKGLPNWDLLFWGLTRDIDLFIKAWLIIFSSTFSIIFLAHGATETRNKYTYYSVLFVYTCIQLSLFAYSAWQVSFRAQQMAMPLAMGLMAEQARMSMKMHSYFREKITWKLFNGEYSRAPVTSVRLLESINHNTKHVFALDIALIDFHYCIEEISKLTYFLFVPTLIYRESYPRTTKVDWLAVIFRLLEFLGIVYYAYLIFREVLPKFGDNYSRQIDLLEFTRLTFACM